VSEWLKGHKTRRVPYFVSVEDQDTDSVITTDDGYWEDDCDIYDDHDLTLTVSDCLKKAEPIIFYICPILLLYMYNYIAGYSSLLFIIYYYI